MSANVKPDSTPHARPRTVWLAQLNSGTRRRSPATTSATFASSRRRIGTPSIARSSSGTNIGKLAYPRRPIATVDSWMAAKNAIQWMARIRPLGSTRAEGHAKRPRRYRTTSASTTAATAVRPSTIATGSHGIHLPKRPANPNSATLAWSAPRAPADEKCGGARGVGMCA